MEEQQKQLETEILTLWGQHQKCEKELAPLLFRLRDLLKTQGKKGGFNAWLKTHNIPRATAYRWIEKYEVKEGLRPVPIPKPKTSYQVRRSVEVAQADYIPAPDSVQKVVSTTEQFIRRINPTERFSAIAELMDRLSVLVRGELGAYCPPTHSPVMVNDPDYVPLDEQEYLQRIDEVEAYQRLLEAAYEAAKQNTKRIRELLKKTTNLISSHQEKDQPIFSALEDVSLKHNNEETTG